MSDVVVHPLHFNKCSSCGHVAPCSEWTPDPKGHPCGADKCPNCGQEGCTNTYPTVECFECDHEDRDGDADCGSVADYTNSRGGWRCTEHRPHSKGWRLAESKEAPHA